MLREAQLVGVGLILHACFLSICVASDQKYQKCRPSSCGDIRNISYPFRLHGNPTSCGYPEYELICENNRTMINLYSGKYHVAEINYHSHDIRLVDPDLKKGNCMISSPLHTIDAYYESYEFPYYFPVQRRFNSIVLMKCEQPIREDNYIPIIPCNPSTINGRSYPSPTPTYAYAVVVEHLVVGDIPYSCTMGENIALHPLKAVSESRNLSMSDLQEDLLLGLQFSFSTDLYRRECLRKGLGYNIDSFHNTVQCLSMVNEDNWNWKSIINDYLHPFIRGLLYPRTFTFQGGWILRIFVIGRIMPGIWCLFAYLIYKFRRRHLFLDDTIEELLRRHKDLQPIRYSYSDIKKMTHNFTNKLGQGGFGSVYNGKLRSGHCVAVKVLILSKANGQDFINEIATIGRIHHVNVVRLVGFCVQGSKWALIYDFMPNGSLDKFVFHQEHNIPLSWEMLYKIALGVGRGIEYLHQGCDMQILHFDIKPHNILLDKDFTLKVSDFGLAKLYPTDESIVSLTNARGTLGYIAPELFYKNIGGVSYKADVYSFGMLLLEMVGRRRNMNALAELSSQIYFPSWIYDRYNRGEDLEMGDATQDAKECIRKIVIVALWCIQMKPIDRPSMSKALEMLEGDVELLEMPPKPTLFYEDLPNEDLMNNPMGATIFSCNSIGTITLEGR